MKTEEKIKRSMWVAMAACAMIFLCIGGCLVYGLHAAEDYIDANCRRDLGALMEQLERPYITRLNTSAFLARAMERYLFSEGERTVDLQGEARFLSALDRAERAGYSVCDAGRAVYQLERQNGTADDRYGDAPKTGGGENGFRLSHVERRRGFFCRGIASTVCCSRRLL